MDTISRELLFPDRTAYRKTEHLHHELLNSIRKKDTFTFNQTTDKVYYNSTCITSGSQALLLKEILELHLSSGRTSFECREFTKKEDLISSPENTGFAVRLGRIQKHLKKNSVPIEIRKGNRGSFSLVIRSEFDLVIR